MRQAGPTDVAVNSSWECVNQDSLVRTTNILPAQTQVTTIDRYQLIMIVLIFECFIC